MPPYDRRPRPVVNDLQNPGQLQPAAAPSVDSYNRPGYQEVDKFHGKNPFEKLADSLVGYEPGLQALTRQESQQYITDEDAKGAQEAFNLGREKVNEMIRRGEVPVGASPWANRGFQRAALKQLGEEYRSQAYQAFLGEEGDEARAQNNPASMRKFLDGQYQKFSEANLGGGYFSSLDLQEVLHPALESANSQLMQAHADHRVKQVEQDYKDLVSVQAGSILDEELGTLTYATSQDDRDAAVQRASERMQDLRDNPDTGFGVSTGLMRTGSELLVDAAIQKAMKTGDRSYLETIDHLTTDQGAPLAKTQAVQAKLLQAEEHVTKETMQRRHFEHWEEGLDFERRSREHTEKGWAVEEERWAQSKEQLKTSLAKQDTMDILTRRMYSALRAPNAQEKTKAVNDVLRIAEEVLPGEVRELQSIVDAATSRQAHVSDDPWTLGSFRIEMEKDPLKFDARRLRQAATNGTISSGAMERLFDDLERKKQNAGHPFVKADEFREMLHAVSKGTMQSPEDEFSAEGQARAADALGAFRGKAAAWIKKNPQGSVEEFNDHMRDQIKPTLERYNPEYGDTKQKERDKAERLRMQKDRQGGRMDDSARRADEAKRQEELDRLSRLQSAPRMGRVSGFEPLTAKDFGGMSSQSQREAILNAKDDETRRRMLTEQFEPEFRVRGQSLKDMENQISIFLHLLAESKKPPTQQTAKK